MVIFAKDDEGEIFFARETPNNFHKSGLMNVSHIYNTNVNLLERVCPSKTSLHPRKKWPKTTFAENRPEVLLLLPFFCVTFKRISSIE